MSVFGFFILVIVKNMKKQKAENTARQAKQRKAADTAYDQEEMFAASQEGAPTIKNVHQKKKQTASQPTPQPVAEDEETDDLIPDFTDEEEIRKAVIASEILQRKDY